MTLYAVRTYLVIEIGLFVRSFVEHTDYDATRILGFATGAMVYYFGKRLLDRGLTIPPAGKGK